MTDLPIGLLLGTVVLDLVDQPAAADIALVGDDRLMVLAALSRVWPTTPTPTGPRGPGRPRTRP